MQCNVTHAITERTVLLKYLKFNTDLKIILLNYQNNYIER